MLSAVLLAVPISLPLFDFSAVRAEEVSQTAPPGVEIFSGFGVNGNSAAGYLGAGTAFGSSLWQPGFRGRIVGAYGGYNYDGTLAAPGGRQSVTFDGNNTYGAALLGYQFQPGRAVVKLFAGIEAEDQDISPRDPNNSVQGSAVGLRVQAESWFDLSARSFVTLDASYGTAFQEYWTASRLGFRLRPKLAVGLEGGAQGNREYNAGRGGAFVQLQLPRVEVIAASGVTGDYLERQGSAYFTLNLYRAF
ncbi:cellulose biosynthesis protein BcsS [Methyloligella sp. 2.7D]|uniref:cellulose biosynthesis protein BcsS n=1 Tax=unclassified Methyloligella TaxID=2625955 RepID=UPI00157D4FBF|nr:cellulose biosynthesis protein BcsS [Methyloligella sp. GL2]QKP78388.1 cellulose biosynthesis protein BcsS [Methyloligella sp. GL2]